MFPQKKTKPQTDYITGDYLLPATYTPVIHLRLGVIRNSRYYQGVFCPKFPDFPGFVSFIFVPLIFPFFPLKEE